MQRRCPAAKVVDARRRSSAAATASSMEAGTAEMEGRMVPA